MQVPGLAEYGFSTPLVASGMAVMQMQLLACTVCVILWALPTAMASAADLLKAGDAAYSSGNYNR
jgi:hypothetical protein